MSRPFSLILASQSPRRREILTALGYKPTVRPSHFDERSLPESDQPDQYALSVALGKAQAARREGKVGEVLLAADLVVWSQAGLLHKPTSEAEAREYLALLGGNWHDEYGACVVGVVDEAIVVDGDATVGSREAKWETRVSRSRIWLPPLPEAAFAQYFAKADVTDKAGGLDLRCYVEIVGPAAVKVEGSITNVIGLDAEASAELLEQAGLPPHQPPRAIEIQYRTAILGE